MNKVIKIALTAILLMIPAFFLIPKTVGATPPPLVCIDTPSNNKSFLSGSNLRVSGWVIAPNGVKAVSIKIDGSDSPKLSYNIPASSLQSRSDVTKALSNYPGASGNKAYDVNFNTGNISNGKHIVYVYVTDVDGNTMTGSATFTVLPLPPPIVCIDTPTVNQTFSNGSSIRVSGWVIAPQGVKAVSVKIDGSDNPLISYNISANSLPTRSDVTSVMSSYPGASGNKAYDVTFSTNNLTGGTHTVYVYVTDVNGNTMTGARTFKVIGPPPPLVCIDTPTSGQNFTTNDSIRVSGWVIAPRGVSSVTVNIDGSSSPNLSYNLHASNLPSRADVSTVMASYPGASSNKAYDVDFNTNYLSAGTHTANVYVTDIYGNTILSSRTFTVTKSPSYLSIDSIDSEINGSEIATNTMTGSMTISGWALNPSTVSNISIYLDGQYQGSATLTGSRTDVANTYPSYPVNDNTGFTYTLDPILTNYSYGNHTLKVVATGLDGSTTTQSSTVVNPSPVLTVTSPVSSMPYTNYNGTSNIQVSGFALDDSIVNNVTVTFDGNILSGVLYSQPSSSVETSYPQYPGSATAGFSAVIPVSMLSNGIHIVTVTSTATDGVTQSKQIAITVGGSSFSTTYSISLTSFLTIQNNLEQSYNTTITSSEIDPNVIQSEFNGLEFLSLKYGLGGTGSTLTADQLETMIPEKAYNSDGVLVNDTLYGHAQAFIDAANEYGINPVYLVAHARLETGNGTSILANGQVYSGNGETYYNMFGIGAFNASPDSSGLTCAYENNWNSIDAAIIGGAKWIATNYINSISMNQGDGLTHYDQDTLYQMKWDPYGASTNQVPYEYATDPDWAYCIASIMYQNINLLTDTNMTLVYNIPQFN